MEMAFDLCDLENHGLEAKIYRHLKELIWKMYTFDFDFYHFFIVVK